ncbi:MAG: tetratricopeptide (TPR) repeat protein [Myxococcota bacterium]|jgi:tetratricopeptide (TPR) repeat protein
MSPGLFWRDSGELAAAGFGLGVAHPTGFPLYMMMCKAATFLPLGHIAFRINLVSAVCAALLVVVTYRLIQRIVGNSDPITRGSAAAAALILGLGQTVFLHATTAEIYIPNALGIALFVTLMVDVLDSGSSRLLRAAAVLTGLAAGLHASFAFIAAVGWVVVITRRRQTLRADILWSAVLGLSAALVVLYLPVRAAAGPWRNWGDPSSASALWDHLSGGRIRRSFGSQMGSGAPLDVNLSLAVFQLADQVSWSGLFGVVGLVLLCLRRLHVGVLLFGVFLADLFFTTVLNPMGIADQQTGVISVLATAIAAGTGGALVGQRVVTRHFSKAFSGTLVFIAVLGLGAPAIFAGGRSRDLRRLQHPADLGEQIFDWAAPGSLVLVSGDDLASITTYQQGVERRRPDVTTLVKQHATDLAYIDHLRSYGSLHLTDAFREAVAGGASGPQVLQLLLDEHQEKRPIYWEVGDTRLDSIVIDDLRPDLPISRLFGEPIDDVQKRMINFRYRWRNISNGPWPGSSLRTLSRRFSLLGTFYMRRGNRGAASLFTGEAFLMDNSDAQVVNNYALMLQMDGAQRQAESQFRKVVLLRPEYALGWYNLGVSLFNRGIRAEAAAAFSEAARLGRDPGRAVKMAFYMAILEANAGDTDRALLLASAALDQASGPIKADIEGFLAQVLSLVSAEARP